MQRQDECPVVFRVLESHMAAPLPDRPPAGPVQCRNEFAAGNHRQVRAHAEAGKRRLMIPRGYSWPSS